MKTFVGFRFNAARLDQGKGKMVIAVIDQPTHVEIAHWVGRSFGRIWLQSDDIDPVQSPTLPPELDATRCHRRAGVPK